MFDIKKAESLGFKEYFKDQKIKDLISNEDYSKEAVKLFLETSFISAAKEEDKESIFKLAMIFKQKYQNKESFVEFRNILRDLDKFMDEHEPEFSEEEGFLYVLSGKDSIRIEKTSIFSTFQYFFNKSENLASIANFFTPHVFDKSRMVVSLIKHNS